MGARLGDFDVYSIVYFLAKLQSHRIENLLYVIYFAVRDVWTRNSFR